MRLIVVLTIATLMAGCSATNAPAGQAGHVASTNRVADPSGGTYLELPAFLMIGGGIRSGDTLSVQFASGSTDTSEYQFGFTNARIRRPILSGRFYSSLGFRRDRHRWTELIAGDSGVLETYRLRETHVGIARWRGPQGAWRSLWLAGTDSTSYAVFLSIARSVSNEAGECDIGSLYRSNWQRHWDSLLPEFSNPLLYYCKPASGDS
jgi:hypothetical protein